MAHLIDEQKFNKAFLESDFHKDKSLAGEPNVTHINRKEINFAQIAQAFYQVQSFTEIASSKIWANKLVDFEYYEVDRDKVPRSAIKKIKDVAHRLFEFLLYLDKEELEPEFVTRYLGRSNETDTTAAAAMTSVAVNSVVPTTIIADEPNVRKQICQTVKVCSDVCEHNVSGNTSAAKEINRFIGELGRFHSKIERSEPNEVIILGPTGVGKSFLLNTLLHLTEVPAPKYGVNWIDDTGYVTEDDDEDAPNRLTLENLPGWLEKRKLSTGTLVTVTPPQSTDETLAAEKDKELKALDALQSFCDEKQREEHVRKTESNIRDNDVIRLSAYDKFKTRLRPFVLTSAPAKHNMPTTAHILEMRFGSSWALEIEYMSIAEIREQLGGFIPAEAKSENQKKVMLDLLIAVVDHSAVQTRTQKRARMAKDEEEEEEVHGFGEYPDDFTGPDDPRLQFKREITNVAGLKFHFESRGLDSLEDRIYIRHLLNGIVS